MPMAHRVNPLVHNWLSIASRTAAEEPAVHDRADDDIYEWPICVTPRCKRRMWVTETGRQACRPCETQAAGHLAELSGLFARLDTTAALMRGSRTGGGATSGSRVPPIPPRMEVLALTGPGGVAARLQAIEDAWRQALDWATPLTVEHCTTFPVRRDDDGTVLVGRPGHGDRVYPHWRTQRPAVAVPKRVTFLANNLLWACSSYESVGQDIVDLRRMHGEMQAIVQGKQRHGDVKIGLCPVLTEEQRCAEQLYASARSYKTACGACRTRWEGDEEWRALRAAQEAVLRADALPDDVGVAA